MKTSNRQGSVIAIALILGTVSLIGITYLLNSLLQAHETTIRYGVSQSAFRLAEGGVELAMSAIVGNDLSTSAWQKTNSDTWTYATESGTLGQYNTNNTIQVKDLGSDIYSITSMSTVYIGGEEVTRALKILVEQERSSVQVQENTGSGVFGYGMVAKNAIKLNHNNPGMKVASYNSDVNFGVPIFGENTSRLVTIATPASYNGAVSINNSMIHGSIRTGGGSINYDSGRHQSEQNATIIGEDSTISSGVDSNYISTDFDGEIPDPELPTSDGYTMVSYDQNYWQNNREITIGSELEPTWVDTERINTNQNAKMTIIGDVVIDAYRNLNLGGDIEIEPGATLTIMAGENIHINANYIDQQYPSQFQVIAKNSQDVVLNNFKVFSGVINAPNSNVRLAGVGGSPKAQFRGAIVAKYIESTNGVEFYYDVKLGEGDSGDSDDSSGSAGDVGSLKVLSWAEIAPEKAF